MRPATHSETLSPRGGVFVMDLYGGSSSERPLIHRRRMPGGYVYRWEQGAFDALTRRTRASISFVVGRGAARRLIRRAFSYDWRLWTVRFIAPGSS